MKLLDKSGRFQLVKNDIVRIDQNLEKYQKIKVLKEERRESRSLMELTDLTRTSSGSSRSGVDAELRSLAMEIRENGFGKHLMDDDGVRFNETIRKILSLEVSCNDYSLNIPESRWIAVRSDVDTPTNVGQYLISYTADDVKDMEGGPVVAEVSETKTEEKKSWLGKIRSVFTRRSIEDAKELDGGKKYEASDTDMLDVLSFFDIIHVETGKEKEFVDAVKSYFALVDKAKSMGQVGQMDELLQRLVIHVYESVLAGNGMCKYITFQDITNLQSKCERVVDIDYLKDFGRVIPDSVVAKKMEADKLCVFDNYCVLYYDATEKMKKESAKKEAAAKRDPILFGLINHSDKLYYIDSWIDENCDLTLDQVVKKIGKDKVGELTVA